MSFPARGVIAIIPVATCLLFSAAYVITAVRTYRFHPRARKENIFLAFFLFLPTLLIGAGAIMLFPAYPGLYNPPLVITFCVLWFFIVLFYFTRPGVKEQFEQ